MCSYSTERRGRAVWIGPTLTADVSELWDEGWGQRDSYEERRHHRLLPGLLEEFSPGVRTSRAGGGAVGGGAGGRWGADVAGVTVKTALKCTERWRGVRQPDRMWESPSVSSCAPQCSHSSECRRCALSQRCVSSQYHA